jgi:hypothetical protein
MNPHKQSHPLTKKVAQIKSSKTTQQTPLPTLSFKQQTKKEIAAHESSNGSPRNKSWRGEVPAIIN